MEHFFPKEYVYITNILHAFLISSAEVKIGGTVYALTCSSWDGV
jgi:hypothetical protein